MIVKEHKGVKYSLTKKVKKGQYQCPNCIAKNNRELCDAFGVSCLGLEEALAWEKATMNKETI